MKKQKIKKKRKNKRKKKSSKTAVIVKMIHSSIIDVFAHVVVKIIAGLAFVLIEYHVVAVNAQFVL